MLNLLLKKYVEWYDYRLLHKEDTKFMKEAYRKEIALAGLNTQNIVCPCCHQNKWAFFEKPQHVEIKIVCSTCGLLQRFHYRVLFSRVQALKEKKDAEDRNARTASEAAKPEQQQELPKEDEEKPVEEVKE